MYLIAYLFLLLSLAFTVFIIYTLGSKSRASLQKRLNRLTLLEQNDENKHPTKNSQKKNIWQAKLEKSIESFGSLGIDITEKEIMLITGISGLLFFLIVYLLNKNPLVSLLFALCGIFMPEIIINFLTKSRAKAFDKLFSDALYLIANTLKSGFSLKQALQIIAQEMPSPICDEFELINEEMNWGLSLEDSMVNLAKRVKNENVELFVTAVTIQSEVGGSLSEIITKIAEAIRQKEEFRRELNVLTSQGKVSGIIVGLMPIFIATLITVMNPAYMLPLFTTSLGMVLLGVAIGMELFGLFVIKLVINVE